MDLSNLKGLLDSHPSDSPEVSDDDLEDELNAILSGKISSHRPKAMPPSKPSSVSNKRVKQNDSKQTRSSRSAAKGHQLRDGTEDLMLPSNAFDINLPDFNDTNEDEEDIDEDDEDLLSEITKIANKPRVENPSQTIETKEPRSEFAGHSSQMIQKPHPPARPAPERPSTSGPSFTSSIDKKFDAKPREEPSKNDSVNDKIIDGKGEIPRLTSLKDDYRRAALIAKKEGHQDIALSHIKTAKQIEILIKALEEGSAVDLSQLPPPPKLDSTKTTSLQPPQPEQPKQSEGTSFEEQVMNVELTTDDAKKFFNAPPPPNTIMEALEQRLNKFKSTLEQANSENNSSKARRLGRIVKQYETAIKDFKKGKVMDFNDLPTPPGFGPIPVANEPKTEAPLPSVNVRPEVKPSAVPVQPVKPSPDKKVGPNRSQNPSGSSPNAPQTSVSEGAKMDQRPALKRASSTANKQLNYLLERQRLFKVAALESKQKGDIQQAKEYLRMAKGFEPLIEATQNGLPIDATSIPTPPQMNDDFVVVSHPETTESDDLEREELFRKIEVELQNQIEMCKRNKDYFLQLGDISTSSKFEKYAIDSRKDLDLLTIRWRNGQKVPNVKYETRTFSIVICNTEVSTNEVSVEVVKAVDIPGKNDIDTYVRIEFPFPNDNNQTAKTKTVKNSINPVFNETVKFEIDRKSRQLPRIFKRHPLKLELMSKGGFLRSDSLIGTVMVKLTDLETKCTIHESFPLTEGKKTIGGRVEAKVKLREPLLAKQVEEVKERWLSIE